MDLLYYHHRYQSFVFVQYKRMTPRTGGPVYRPGGRTYEMELRRMREADLATRTGTAPTTIREYRLWPGAFFFKLCPNVDLDADAAELIKGMYIPLDYWDVLVADARGPRGGAVVTYAGAERWLNNTLFVSLVQDGWIGSAGATTAQLNRIVRAVLEQNHSVIVAVSSVA
ncbi:MAG: hypothetical protein EPO22_03375 [Dehalococcoidia bacterium]|nr:MAG: hypothetical protein EPO22_03375 [Dehalococcoidia bacterium]